ncbi:HAD family hydrolase [Flexivirga meconopsidis]|uniref:HAD family hydrolase n=1 Tax=Flexivirga meconopsidis TaxID=2977121 RepID=UPI00223FF74D
MTQAAGTLPVHAVLLDIDDTLLDTTAAMIGAGEVAMAAVWPDESDVWRQAAARRFRSDPGGFFKRYTAGELDFEQMRAARLAEVGAAQGRSLPDDAIDVYEAAFRPAFLERQRVYDDVLPFLDACAAAGLRFGALTNSSAAATQSKLSALGLEGRLGPVVTRDTLGVGKPDPAVFRHAVAELGSDPSRTAYIGDEFEADVLGPARAGLQPIWLRRPRHTEVGHAPDAAISDATAPDDVPVITGLDQLRPDAAGLAVLDLGRTAPAR